MSVILQPQVAFPLVRQIANHTDSTVYYVRAVIRNAAGEIIDTVNLAAQGDQRYQTSWQVIPDSSGRGAYISIVTSVYTDSGYTTKSENYGDEETTYLVFDRVMPSMRGGGGGLDIRTLRRVLADELDKLPKPEKPKDFPEFPKFPDMPFDQVRGELAAIKSAVSGLPTEQTDLTGITEAIDRAIATIEQKEVTPETDLSPVLDQIGAVANELRRIAVQLQTSEEEIARRIVREFGASLQTMLAEVVAGATFTLAPTTAKMDVKETKQDEGEKSVPFNIEQLAI